ncbi:hypothetical protein LguiB_004796 [Lonicera macranthoides]
MQEKAAGEEVVTGEFEDGVANNTTMACMRIHTIIICAYLCVKRRLVRQNVP